MVIFFGPLVFIYSVIWIWYNGPVSCNLIMLLQTACKFQWNRLVAQAIREGEKISFCNKTVVSTILSGILFSSEIPVEQVPQTLYYIIVFAITFVVCLTKKQWTNNTNPAKNPRHMLTFLLDWTFYRTLWRSTRFWESLRNLLDWNFRGKMNAS